MSKCLLTIALCLACVALMQPPQIWAEESLVLENSQLALRFDRKTGTLTALENKLAQETYSVGGDEFAVEAEEFRLGFSNTRLASLELQAWTIL